MAGITFTTIQGRFTGLQGGATSTTTNWVTTPGWANLAIVHLDVTAAGTNTILTLKAAGPTRPPDDSRAITFFTSATITAASYHTYTLDPRATSVADAAGASTMAVVPAVVPAMLGITTTPTGSTYSTWIEFRGI